MTLSCFRLGRFVKSKVRCGDFITFTIELIFDLFLLYILQPYRNHGADPVAIAFFLSSEHSFEMSSWITRATANHKAQLITTAVVSGVVVGGAILGFQKARRLYRVETLKESTPDIGEEHHATRVSSRRLIETICICIVTAHILHS